MMTLILAILALCVSSRTLFSNTYGEGDLHVLAEQVDTGIQFTVTRDITNTAGWFAVGFPSELLSMVGTRAVICTDNGIKVYDILAKTSMDPNQRVHDFIQTGTDTCIQEDNEARMVFTIDNRKLHGESLAWAMNVDGVWDPEATTNCYHGSHKKIETLMVVPEYFYVNLWDAGEVTTGDSLWVKLAGALDDTFVELSNGQVLSLNAQETQTVLIPGAGSFGFWVKSSKPIGVFLSVNFNGWQTILEFSDLTSAGRDFMFYTTKNDKFVPRVMVYALEDTKITVQMQSKNGFTTTLVSDVAVGAGMAWSVETPETRRNIIRVLSTGTVLTAFEVGNQEFQLGSPVGSSALYGAHGGRTVAMTWDDTAVHMSCSDDETSKDSTGNFQNEFGQWQAWDSPACRFDVTSGDGNFSVVTWSDGSGGNSVQFADETKFGVVGVVPVDVNFIKLVSNGPSSCVISEPTVDQLEVVELECNQEQNICTGNFTHGIGIQGTAVKEGTTISCDNPVLAITDTNFRNEELLVQMMMYEDPCAACSDEWDPVCIGNQEFANECQAKCRLMTAFVAGECQPSLAPTTSQPSETPSFFPTTTRPTEVPVAFLNTDNTVLLLKNMLAETQRQLMLSAVLREHEVSSSGSSGMTRIRSNAGGTEPYGAEGGIVNNQMLGMHNHPNFHRKMGLGEFGAVLNGVRFDTRHNDYKLHKPSLDAIHTLDATDDIEWPEVPQDVLDKPTVAEQVAEMQEYFRAFKNQDITHRDYRDFFKPVLCVVEGAWVKDTGDLEDFFSSDRHEIDADTWEQQWSYQIFRQNSGKKHILENTPFLPTKITEIKTDSLNGITYPVYANFEYRIVCQNLADDVPTERFIPDMDENMMRKVTRPASGLTETDLALKKSMKFKLNALSQKNWDKAKSKGKTPGVPEYFRRSYLDTLMEQIPGKDGPGGNLIDTSFDVTATKFESTDDNPEDLNTAFYSRWFKYTGTDAMGRNQQQRGWNDLNMFAAMTSHQDVAGYTACDRDDSEKCSYQRWTYAIPLEIVYMTPLGKWNPYNLPEATKKQFTEGPGDGTLSSPYTMYSDIDFFMKTPADFYTADAARDPADTGANVYVQTSDMADPQLVSPSGTMILTDEIGGDVGRVRLRWPIFPVHERSTLAFREAAAGVQKTKELEQEVSELKDLVSQLVGLVGGLGADTSGLAQGSNTEEMIGKWTESTYPSVTLISGPGFGGHVHDIWCDWQCFVSLMDGDDVTVISQLWDTHEHEFTFRLGDLGKIDFVSCPTCGPDDPHDRIDLPNDNLEVFLVPSRL